MIPEERMEKKRERSANFSHQEVTILVNLVLKYIHVIENKRTDGATWKRKDDIWCKVTKEFNCQAKTNRSIKMLRIKYESLKKILKKKRNANKNDICNTAGGIPKIVPYTDYEERLLSVLLFNIEGLTPETDNDADPLEISKTEIVCAHLDKLTPITLLLEEHGNVTGDIPTDIVSLPACLEENIKKEIDINMDALDEDTSDEYIHETTWTEWTPISLRKSVSDKLKMQKPEKEQTNEKFATLADQQTAVLDKQNLVVARELEIKNKELQIREKELEIKHKALQIKEKEFEIKTRELETINTQNERTEKEHKLRMLILEAQYENEKNKMF